MGRKNVIAGLVLLMIGIGYGTLTSQLPERAVKGVPGISFFPWVITTVLVALSLILAVQGWLGIRRGEAASFRRPFSVPVAAMLFLFLVYIAALPYLGFLIASVPFFTGLMALYGARNKLFLIVAGPGIPIALFFLFRDVFQIPLPRATLAILGG